MSRYTPGIDYVAKCDCEDEFCECDIGVEDEDD